MTSANLCTNNLYHLTRIKEVIDFLHRCCFLLPISTWCKAINKGFFQSWPHLTSSLVRKHLPLSPNTVLGHQHCTQQNIRFTKKTIKATKNIALIVQPDKLNNKLFTDQTDTLVRTYLHIIIIINYYCMYIDLL